MAIEKLVFTSWADAEVEFAVDWDFYVSQSITKPLSREELFSLLHGVATFAINYTIGHDLNNWGTYYHLCQEFGKELFDGSKGIVYVTRSLPDIELSEEPDAIPLDKLPTPPEQPSW